MATNWNSAEVKCPFYINDKPLNITCEGMFSLRCTHFFFNKHAKEKQMRIACQDNFSNCDYYKFLKDNKYK